MNKAKLKSYAPQARKDFIAAVEARAHSLGLSEMGGTLDIAPSEKKGDVTLIAGQAWPAKVHDQRQRLIKRMKKDGFAQTVEAVAYTWFNRFAALRYMEIHDYLDHGYRVLSSREGGLPEIIAHATEVAGSLPGLNAAQIADMKLAGNQDGELYRLLLIAQCNALSKAMPFLFEHIDDESELLLPGNLERTDSVVAKLVESIAEEDWSEVEVIGWLYQFYISEKKDAVIGRVVKSEDIPAATQLFTPNWIVQYLVQNSVGRLWLMANPASTLKSQWKYYIEPAEQTPEVQAQLDALIQIRMAEDGGSLNPETMTVLDPACGSGHILVEAYEVLKAIYLERGYQARAIPRLILEKNLFGLDIDDRAAQMAGFALMMKARADDRRLLDSPIKLNVLSLQKSKGLELDEFDSHLKPFGISRALLGSLIDTFAHAKTFGSLIQVPEAIDVGLPALIDGLGKAIQSGDVFAQAAAQDLWPLAGQATILAMKFDAVVANPPYMGSNGMDPLLKKFVRENFNESKNDLFASFIERSYSFARPGGHSAMVTEEEQWVRFRRNSMEELISYAVGCMMGRYSLDEPGLIYAHAGNVGFAPTRYKTFLADADGIVPITDELWFEDDATNRVSEFLRAVWGGETLEENIDWLAEILGKKGTETPEETIRCYLSGSFFKDHLQAYKKRPIYWHFSSGKQGAFQALVYLHRYHEGTLARMRAEYVVPLTGKMQSRIEMLEKDRDAASATAARTKIVKQIESLKKKHLELLAYDEKLRHYADMRIQLDLDDGVKVNYGKFGDLLAEVKAVTGGAGDE
jgi:hypothetical protein